jgi:hypothetical protein
MRSAPSRKPSAASPLVREGGQSIAAKMLEKQRRESSRGAPPPVTVRPSRKPSAASPLVREGGQSIAAKMAEKQRRESSSNAPPPVTVRPVKVRGAYFHIQDLETRFELGLKTISGRSSTKIVRLAEIEDLASFRRTIVDGGVSLFETDISEKELHQEVMRQAREVAPDRERERRLTSKLGWHDDGSVFVMENDTIPAGTNLVFEARPEWVYARTRTAGNFEEWVTEVAVPAACSSRFITMCGASLLPALMSVAGKPVGGFGIDVGGRSRTGKSTVLKVAKSQSDEPTLDTWGISRAGATAVLLGHTDFPIFLDETAAVRGDGKIISEFTDLLSGGRPDTLAPAWVAERDPGRSQGTIRSVLLSTTEGQLAPRRQGQRARLIELPATRPGSFGIIDYPERADPPITNADEAGQLIDRLDKACGRHYGHVLSRFVECIISDSERLPALIECRVNDFNRATGSAPQDGWTRSVQAWFALIYAALDLARIYEILPWSEAEILDAVLRCFQDVVQREASSETPVLEIVERIRSWIANAGQTATVGKDFEADRLEDYHVIHHRDGGELVALVQRKHLIPVAGSEAALGRALAKIKEQGMLKPNPSDGKILREKRLPDVKSKLRFVFFNAAFAQGNSVKSNQ